MSPHYYMGDKIFFTPTTKPFGTQTESRELDKVPCHQHDVWLGHCSFVLCQFWLFLRGKKQKAPKVIVLNPKVRFLCSLGGQRGSPSSLARL